MIDKINNLIKTSDIDTDLISDGWHTFGELYQHRSELFIVLCKFLKNQGYIVTRSIKHFDGTEMDGYFVLAIKNVDGSYISYHMNMNDYEKCNFANDLNNCPIKGKYTSKIALENLQKL